jgi:hypothetical protein
MTLDQFRSLRDASPFRPFTIHLAGGRSLAVPHREFVSVSPGGRTLIVYQADEAFSVVDLLLVAELSVEGQPANPASPGT